METKIPQINGKNIPQINETKIPKLKWKKNPQKDLDPSFSGGSDTISLSLEKLLGTDMVHGQAP